MKPFWKEGQCGECGNTVIFAFVEGGEPIMLNPSFSALGEFYLFPSMPEFAVAVKHSDPKLWMFGRRFFRHLCDSNLD